jgi:hypothetical protein
MATGPFGESQIAQGIEQDRAGQDNRGIGKNEIFRFEPAADAERIYADRGQHQQQRLQRRLPLAAPPRD